jgi:hypothetical protein
MVMEAEAMAEQRPAGANGAEAKRAVGDALGMSVEVGDGRSTLADRMPVLAERFTITPAARILDVPPWIR